MPAGIELISWSESDGYELQDGNMTIERDKMKR